LTSGDAKNFAWIVVVTSPSLRCPPGVVAVAAAVVSAAGDAFSTRGVVSQAPSASAARAATQPLVLNLMCFLLDT
jgi:hypothetical protein